MAQLQKKSGARKQSTNPVALPLALWAILRNQGTYRVMDENAANKLNDYADPVCIKNSRGEHILLYRPATMKTVLSFLVKTSAWGRSVVVKEKKKAAAGNVQVGVVSVSKQIRVFRRTSYEEFREARRAALGSAAHDQNLVLEAEKCAMEEYEACNLLFNCLGGTGVHRLLDADAAVANGPVEKEFVMSPDNICKDQHLQSFGYVKLDESALPNSGTWKLFSEYEDKRAKALDMKGGASITDTLLSSMTPDQARQHNEYVLNNLSLGSVDGSTILGLNKKMRGSAVDPAIVFRATTVAPPKTSTKKTGYTSEEYTALLKRYEIISHHKLKLKDEMSKDRYDVRKAEVERAEAIIVKDPSIEFQYRPDLDRMCAITVSYVPISQVAPTVTVRKDQEIKHPLVDPSMAKVFVDKKEQSMNHQVQVADKSYYYSGGPANFVITPSQAQVVPASVAHSSMKQAAPGPFNPTTNPYMSTSSNSFVPTFVTGQKVNVPPQPVYHTTNAPVFASITPTQTNTPTQPVPNTQTNTPTQHVQNKSQAEVQANLFRSGLQQSFVMNSVAPPTHTIALQEDDDEDDEDDDEYDTDYMSSLVGDKLNVQPAQNVQPASPVQNVQPTQDVPPTQDVKSEDVKSEDAKGEDTGLPNFAGEDEIKSE